MFKFLGRCLVERREDVRRNELEWDGMEWDGTRDRNRNSRAGLEWNELMGKI